MASLSEKDPSIRGSNGILYSMSEFFHSYFPTEVNRAFPIWTEGTMTPVGWKYEDVNKGFQYGYFVIRAGVQKPYTEYGFWVCGEYMTEIVQLVSHWPSDLGFKILEWLDEK